MTQRLVDLMLRAAAFLIATRCLLWPTFVVGLGTTMLIATRMRRLEHDTDITPLPSPKVLLAVSRVGRAEALTRRWKRVGCERVREQVYSDYELIPAYTVTGILGSLLAASALPAGTERVAVGWFLGMLWLGAGVLDAIENGLLLVVLSPRPHARWQHAAFAVAAGKWALVALAGLGTVGALGGAIWLQR